jgi:hypothetical protein
MTAHDAPGAERGRVEQAYADSMMEGSPIDADGNRKSAAHDTPEAARLRESLLAAKAANTNVLRTLAYRGLDKGHPGIFAREVEAAIDAALSGTEYQPLDEAHGAQVGWTRDRLRAALAPAPSEPLDLDGKPFCPTGYAQRYHATGECDCAPKEASDAV